jgi:hypothetical protein
MAALNQQIDDARRALQNAGHDTTHVEKLADVICRLDRRHYDVSFAEFHNYAGRLPYVADSDFGALVLEREADVNATGSLKARFYREAMWRARWCAQSASAGGEGLARIEAVDRLMTKINEAEQDCGGQPAACRESE